MRVDLPLGKCHFVVQTDKSLLELIAVKPPWFGVIILSDLKLLVDRQKAQELKELRMKKLLFHPRIQTM